MGGDATVKHLVAQFIYYRDNRSATAVAAGAGGAPPSDTSARARSSTVSSQHTGAGVSGQGSGFSSTGGRVLVDLHTQQVCFASFLFLWAAAMRSQGQPSGVQLLSVSLECDQGQGPGQGH